MFRIVWDLIKIILRVNHTQRFTYYVIYTYLPS